MASGSTTRASIPYPLSTDTANISSDMQALAQRVADIIPPWSSGSTAPGSPADGQIWWNTDKNSSYAYGLNYWSGDLGAWVAVGDDIQVVSTDPSAPFLNLIVYNTATRALKYYNGTSWINIIPATGAAGYIYVVDSTATGSNTAWKQLPSSGVKHYFNSSNSVAIGTTATAINFGTVASITGFSKYKIEVSFPVSITAAGATALASSVTVSGGVTGNLKGGFYTAVPSTANNSVITVSYTVLYDGTDPSAGLTFGATATKTGAGTLTSYGATLSITPVAY